MVNNEQAHFRAWSLRPRPDIGTDCTQRRTRNRACHAPGPGFTARNLAFPKLARLLLHDVIRPARRYTQQRATRNHRRQYVVPHRDRRPGVPDAGRLSRLQRHSLRAGRRPGRRPADRSQRGRADLLRHLHGKAGRLRQAVLSRVPAGRRLRQGHRTVRLLGIDRGRRDQIHRPLARQRGDRRRVRPADLWRRLAVRGRVRGLPLRRRAVPAEQHPEAADARRDRPGRIQLHHGRAARHAADPEHHPHHVLQDHRLGRAGWA